MPAGDGRHGPKGRHPTGPTENGDACHTQVQVDSASTESSSMLVANSVTDSLIHIRVASDKATSQQMDEPLGFGHTTEVGAHLEVTQEYSLGTNEGKDYGEHR